MSDKQSVKNIFIADPGFLYGECDFSQAETYGTAYITGDPALLEAILDKSKDFHGLNASRFFGVPYEEIILSYKTENGKWFHKKLNKKLRDLSKRTNHGANYNMGENVMAETMGTKLVLEARALLGLPKNWKLNQVTKYLLDAFSKTYKVVRVDYQQWIKTTVAGTGMLKGATGWVRKCFGDPKNNKLDLNSYIAHCPQSLNAQILNDAFLSVFINVWLPNQDNFKLIAQIHDSILFQYRIGHEYLAEEVRQCMIIPTPVTDIFGVTRTMTVPADVKIGGTHWSKLVEG